MYIIAGMADEQVKLAFEMDLGEAGERLDFESPGDLRKWADTEHKTWEWIQPAGGTLIEHVWNQHRTFHDRIVNFSTEWNQNLSRPEEVRQSFRRIEEWIEKYYPTKLILNSTSPGGRFVFELRKQRGDQVAAGAYAFLTASVVRMSGDAQPGFMEGLVEAFLFKRKIDWSAEAERQSLDSLRVKYEEQVVKQDERFEEIERQNKELNDNFKTSLEGREGDLKTLHTVQTEEFKNITTQHVTKLKAIEETFKAKLALRAPVRYWRIRKDYHSRRSAIFGFCAVGIGLLVGSGMAWLVSWTFRGLGPTDNPKHWQIGILLVAAFFSIWTVRIFVRLFFSHLHLATDAAERRTMILTYLSMALEGEQVAPTDKKLVLQHIFRSASDGLVKDDAAPPSFLELLTRTK